MWLILICDYQSYLANLVIFFWDLVWLMSGLTQELLGSSQSGLTADYPAVCLASTLLDFTKNLRTGCFCALKPGLHFCWLSSSLGRDLCISCIVFWVKSGYYWNSFVIHFKRPCIYVHPACAVMDDFDLRCETVLMLCSVIPVLHDVALLKGFEQGPEPAASNELSSLRHSLSNSVYLNVGMSPHLGT